MHANRHPRFYKAIDDCHRMLVSTVAATALVLAPSFIASAVGGELADRPTLDDYQKKGLEAAMQAKGALGGELMKAMKAGGPDKAVAFCNTRALPITQAMSNQLGVDVSRVSDQPRNPANAASEEQLAVIAAFKETLAAGDQPAPAMREHGEVVTGYYPIVTNAVCLKCHGQKGVDINPTTLSVIASTYPDDQATGYSENELRGLFVVEMQRSDDDAGATTKWGDQDE